MHLVAIEEFSVDGDADMLEVFRRAGLAALSLVHVDHGLQAFEGGLVEGAEGESVIVESSFHPFRELAQLPNSSISSYFIRPRSLRVSLFTSFI